MKIYRVIGGTFVAGAGMLLLLNPLQADARRHNLEPFVQGKAPQVVKTRHVLEFKAGEVIGLGSVPKGFVERLEEVTKAQRSSPEAAMLEAAAALEDAAAKAERTS